tara:strand:+ start:9184 stop:9534 length:351 start_codon:yes stop_codon:yes gene_type:complete
MIISILKAIRQLLGYLLLAAILLSNPVGWYFIYLLTKIRADITAYNLWLAIDRLFCRISHGTYQRTISGWTGQWAISKKRYYYQAKVIDWLVLKLSGQTGHCFKAYLWEVKKGFVK